jgi:hypothetical protein
MRIGKTGRSERSRFDRRTLWFGRYATPPGYTAPPPLDDWTGPIATYTFLGNDRVGCCTRTCYGHIVQQRCALLGVKCDLTADDVLKAYQNGTGWDGVPGSESDRGDQILNALVQLRHVGFRDGQYKIRQFGRVNHDDPIEMRAALHLFGSLIVGANLPKAIIRQGTRWDVNPPGQRQPDEAPGSAGGHAFIITAHQHGRWSGVPWIDKVDLTYAWEDLYIDEAWFVVDDLWVTRTRNAPSGFDYERLEADVAAITA